MMKRQENRCFLSKVAGIQRKTGQSFDEKYDMISKESWACQKRTDKDLGLIETDRKHVMENKYGH